MKLTNEQRVLNVIHRKDVDYLPSQVTLADRTRDVELCKQLGIPPSVTLDDYMGNHLLITLSGDDLPLVYRNDVERMKELEGMGFAGVDLENRVVYDKWGVGIKMFVDGFFPCFHPLQRNFELNRRAERGRAEVTSLDHPRKSQEMCLWKT